MKGYVKVDVRVADTAVKNYYTAYQKSKAAWDEHYKKWCDTRVRWLWFFTRTNKSKYDWSSPYVFAELLPEVEMYAFESDQRKIYAELKHLCLCCADGSVTVDGELARFINKWGTNE